MVSGRSLDGPDSNHHAGIVERPFVDRDTNGSDGLPKAIRLSFEMKREDEIFLCIP